MEIIVFEVPEKRWECPSCGFQHVTRDARPITPTHPCPKFNGFSVPLVEVIKGDALKKLSVQHVVKEREDYIAGEDVQYGPDGRPIMALHTERADGSNDTRIYAPTSHPER